MPPYFSHLLCAIHCVQRLTQVISKPDNPNKARTILPVDILLRKVEPYPKAPQPVRKELGVNPDLPSYQAFPHYHQIRPWMSIWT